MDYFQSTHQQPSNTGGASGNQQQHQQHQQQPQQHHQQQQQQQQYHQYNGMPNQHNAPSQNNSQLYYQQQQQLYSQAHQAQNFTIQPASANAPLDHGSQHQHNPSSYHHTASSHNNGSHHQQQQQPAHHNSSIQSLQQQHQQQQQQQHHVAQQSHQQQSHHGAVGGTGAHMNYSQIHHPQQRRAPMTSLMNNAAQSQVHHHSQQQQSNQQQHSQHQHPSQQQQPQHHAQGQQLHHQAHQQHAQHHLQQQQHQQIPQQQPQHPQQHQQQSMGGSSVVGGHQQHLGGGQQMSHPYMMPPGPPLGAPGKEMPVRIVIDSKYVGAVIGQSGAQIREITKDSHAKVVVESAKAGPKDAQGNTEKVINVTGSPENCTRAVSKILEVVHRELQKDEANAGAECELKIRAHNQLVGRLIGKQGATIKKIMTETGTTILVSNEQQNRSDQPPYNQQDLINMIERTISVKGPAIENLANAEARISAKLKKCYDTDYQHRVQLFQANIPGGMNTAMIHQLNNGDPFAVMRNGPPNTVLANNMKSVRMWVPDSMVGALIGTKGRNIKTIIRESGAHVKIESPDEKEKRDAEHGENGSDRKEERHELLEDSTAEPQATGDSPTSNTEKSEDESIEKKAEERMVTINGLDIQLLKAQTMIYAKIAEQGPTAYDELKLRTEISVPSKIVGRIIGKKGQNVRELQRISGATVKIPEEERNGSPEMVYKDKDEEDTTVVRIIGNVQASHNVQFRLSQLVADFNRLNLDKRGETSPIRPHNISPTSK